MVCLLGRNKLIYGPPDFAMVVSSDYKTGGTWGGAVKALKGRLVSGFFARWKGRAERKL